MEITYIKYNKKNTLFFDKKRINSKSLDIYPYEKYKGNNNVRSKFT